MWTFTTDGFFSVVAHWDNPDLLIVRARDRESLENLAYKFSQLGVTNRYNNENKFMKGVEVNEHWLAEIKDTPDHDYPYRFTVLRETWAQYLTIYIENHNHINKPKRDADLQYTNFKDACDAAGFDAAKLIALHRVWETMAYDWNDAQFTTSK